MKQLIHINHNGLTKILADRFRLGYTRFNDFLAIHKLFKFFRLFHFKVKKHVNLFRNLRGKSGANKLQNRFRLMCKNDCIAEMVHRLVKLTYKNNSRLTLAHHRPSFLPLFEFGSKKTPASSLVGTVMSSIFTINLKLPILIHRIFRTDSSVDFCFSSLIHSQNFKFNFYFVELYFCTPGLPVSFCQIECSTALFPQLQLRLVRLKVLITS